MVEAFTAITATFVAIMGTFITTATFIAGTLVTRVCLSASVHRSSLGRGGIALLLPTPIRR